MLRLLNYENHANMGRYREATESRPDVEAHRQQGRLKYGFGINAEQTAGENARLFGRWGWNEGKNESFAYTEANSSVAAGGDLRGKPWKRTDDRIGAVFVVNGISGDHRDYLKRGGLGFIVGDGNLTYGREQIFESYYRFQIVRSVSVSCDIQHITNPGYNRDRGPVWVPGARVHVEFQK